MNILKSKNIRNITTASMIQLGDGIRLVYQFAADPGYFHDAGSTTGLYGKSTRLATIADAEVVPEQFADIRFKQACATV